MKTQPGKHEVRVLVAYEDLAAGKRAMARLKRVGNQCGGTAQLVHMLWRFDVLCDPAFLDFAVSEALEAEIIVIATREGEGLPQRIRDWIAHWLLLKQDRPLALVADLDHKRTPANCEPHVLPYLSRLARYGKMKFFADGCDLATKTGLASNKPGDSAWDGASLKVQAAE